MYTPGASSLWGGLTNRKVVVMPSNRNLKSDDVDGFMLAVWDSWRDLEAEYGVSILVTIKPRDQRGHLKFEATATRDQDGAIGWVIAVSEAIWPTHYAKSQHALLYALLVRLWRELEQVKGEVSEASGEPA